MAAAVVGAVLALLSVLLSERLRLVVTDESGNTVVSAALPPSHRYAIDYQHSYYDEPATEEFAADESGFRVASISSPSEAVLDYYDVAGARTVTAAGVHVLMPAEPAVMTELPLIATEKGRRTLVIDGRRYPLYLADRDARHVVLHVTAESRLDRLLPWRS